MNHDREGKQVVIFLFSGGNDEVKRIGENERVKVIC